jgi:Uncharacterized membrane-associated protein/domain
MFSGIAAGSNHSDLAVEQHGDGIALEDESSTYLWQYSPYSVTVSFAAPTDSMHTVCLSEYNNGNTDNQEPADEPLACELTAVDSSESTSVTLTQSEWPDNFSGETTLAVEIYDGRGSSGEPREQVLLPVHIIEKDGDLDGNGLTNEREIGLGTHPAVADSDDDGLTDGVEVMLGTDPRDGSTPYRIAIITVGSLTAGAFGFLLVAGRFMTGLRKFGVSTGNESTAETETETTSEPAAEQAFDPPVRDEEQVRQLLSTHDGRLKQSQIVEATDWSKSKVSRLLSSMEDDEDITRIRLGRENLVCLRGHEPADITPSWEDKDGSST